MKRILVTTTKPSKIKMAHFGKKVMNIDMESLYSNQVWFLVSPLDGVKPIGYKWIYKRKRMIDRKVKTFQAQLMEKGSYPERMFLIPSSL